MNTGKLHCMHPASNTYCKARRKTNQIPYHYLMTNFSPFISHTKKKPNAFIVPCGEQHLSLEICLFGCFGDSILSFLFLSVLNGSDCSKVP